MSSIHIPLVSGNRLLLPTTTSASPLPVIVGSEAWYNWLADEQNRSFSFRNYLGTCTVQRERQGNGWYWYAYRKQEGKMRKAYLGKSKELTLIKLNKTIARLVGKDTDASTLQMPQIGFAEDLSQATVDEQYSLTAPTPDSFQPLEPAVPGKYHLPAQSTPLIGREQDVVAACTLLQRSELRLITLAGTGGIGKTRLGLQIASELISSFADGVYFVPLASLVDPDLVIPTIAYTLGLTEASDWSQLERLHTFLRDKHLLLLLDNFEQVVSSAPKIAELLEVCPKLKVLVTSRATLHIRGEYTFPVQPLTLPDVNRLTEGEDLEHYSAIALFLERARAMNPAFKGTAASTRAIAEICIRLDGLPLTIELAAARLKVLSPQALLARLEHRLQILTSSSQDVPVRQQTLRNTLAWSYDLLTAQEQQIFRQLSVFVGSCTLDAAEVLCNIDSDVSMHRSFSLLDDITSLIDNSLLHQTTLDEEEPRLVMLETIRVYGLERLIASGESIAVQRAHAAYYLALAETAEPMLTGEEQGRWFERLQQEHGNLRAALQWFIRQKEWELALRLGNALWRFWWACGHLSEGRQALEQVLQSNQDVSATVQAKALNAVGALAGMQGDFGRSEALCRESLTLFREQGDLQGCATSLWMLGNVALMKGNGAMARSLEEEALTLFQQVDDTWGIVSSLERLASVATDEGDFNQALFYAEKALALSRQESDTWGIARALDRLVFVTYTQGNLARTENLLKESLLVSRKVGDKRTLAYSLAISGYVACARGDYTSGRGALEESIKLSMEVGDRRGRVWGLSGLGWVFFSQGDFTAARAQYEESLTILRKADYAYRSFIALGLEGLAGTVAAQGNPVWAARLWGAAEALHTTDDGPPVPLVLRPIYERLIAILRTQLDEESFTTAWAQGRAMTLEQVLTEQEPPRITQASVPLPTSTLTTREREVLRLLATGMSSAQIAEELFITILTVNSHIRSIYNKIGVKSRSAATRYAIDHKLA